MIEHPAILRLLDLLNDRDVRYMISGAVASMYYGEPRLTHDLDLVVDMDLEAALKLHGLLSKEFYISEQSTRNAVEHKTMFNMIHFDSGLKIDFWILTESEFDLSRFKRRVEHEIEGRKYHFSSPEDTVLIKLIWLKEPGYMKHAEDIKGILRTKADELDFVYIGKWIARLGVQVQAESVGLQSQG